MIEETKLDYIFLKQTENVVAKLAKLNQEFSRKFDIRKYDEKSNEIKAIVKKNMKQLKSNELEEMISNANDLIKENRVFMKKENEFEKYLVYVHKNMAYNFIIESSKEIIKERQLLQELTM